MKLKISDNDLGRKILKSMVGTESHYGRQFDVIDDRVVEWQGDSRTLFNVAHMIIDTTKSIETCPYLAMKYGLHCMYMRNETVTKIDLSIEALHIRIINQLRTEPGFTIEVDWSYYTKLKDSGITRFRKK
jgi:hypothetical protein